MAFNIFKTLRIRWSKREDDWMIDYPTSPTGHMATGFISGRIDFPELLEELKQRGYDVTTLKLSVDKRVFKCIKSYKVDGVKVFSKGDIAYMKSDEEKSVALTNPDRYSYAFSKNKSEDNYLYDYFVEETKKE